MFTENGQNQLLGATDITHVGTSTAYPGESGANEQTGGSPAYARTAMTFGAASGRTLTVAGTPALNIADGEDHAWWTFWDADSAGNCRAILPNGGTAKEYCVDPTTDIITCVAHGSSEDDPIVFYMVAPSGLVAGTIYYALNVTTDTFQVQDMPGDGYAIDIGHPAAGPAVVSAITVDPGSGGQRVITLGPNATLHNAF
jgi:hypothetical protein